MTVGPLVFADNLGDEFDIGTIETGTIRVADELDVYVEKFAGGSTNGAAGGAWGRNATVTRTGTGQWTVVFASAHPDGVNYHVSFSSEEPANTRDQPKVTIDQGSKTANGFTFAITQDDNGGTADTYVDQPWTFGVTCPETVLVPPT